MLFISRKKLLIFCRYLNICSDFRHRGKRLVNKFKGLVNFNVYGVANCEINNCNTHFAQYLKKQMQSDNESGSIVLEKHTQHVAEKLVPDPFLKIKIERNSGSTV